ncbi:MAG: hypothetical protein SNF33_07790 [Candidatus Algichlamydia australiensis]|nr:hypothetical protein [Chlamydiales bacterium]
MDVETFRYTLEDQLFVPKIAESLDAFDPALGYNGAIVELKADLSSDLNWELPEFDGYILWKLHFQISELNLQDSLAINSYKRALEHFCETVLPKFEKSIGVILYSGSARVWEKIVFTEDLKEEIGDEPIELFSLTLFSEFLHTLGALLPEGIPPFALFDCKGVEHPLALFNKERFPHVELGLKDVAFPIFGLRWQSGEAIGGYIGAGEIPETAPSDTKIGVVVPEGPCNFLEIEEKILKIQEKYRLIFESTITTSWDELAELKCFNLSEMGKRMVEGFVAAGGRTSG